MNALTNQGIKAEPMALRPKHRLKPVLLTSDG